MNILSHCSWTAITPSSQSLKASQSHWDHGRQYVMSVLCCNSAPLVLASSLLPHWLCLSACCALKCFPEHVVRTVRNWVNSSLWMSLSLFTCSDLLWLNVRTLLCALSHRDEYVVTLKVLFEMSSVLHWSFRNYLPLLFMDVHFCFCSPAFHFVLFTSSNHISDVYVKSKW